MNAQTMQSKISSPLIPALIVSMAVALLLLWWILTQDQQMLALQLAISIVLVVVGIVSNYRRDTQLPVLFRPAVAVVASVLVGSMSASRLSQSNYQQFMVMFSALSLGVVVGLIITQDQPRHVRSLLTGIDLRRLVSFARIVLVVSLLAAAIFFAWKGVPALGANVEEGRVDAASVGSGYFRLLAYMSIPAALILVATRQRLGLPATAISTIVILGLANRSPLLYLFVPLLFILYSQKRVRLTSFRILAAVAVLAVVVVSIGTFRVFSQQDFASYQEYEQDIAAKNYIGVGFTSFTHYADVVSQNAVLTKSLVDSGAIPLQFGASYLTLVISALPGQQLSLDRQIKKASGKDYVGGGTPPTLMGEGYVNFGLAGTLASGFFMVWLLRHWSRRYSEAAVVDDGLSGPVTAAIYGYVLCWIVGSPVAGLAGASTVSLAGFLLLVVMRLVSANYRKLPS
jgi:oligosaccharide repeat unit polymerase